MNGASLPHVPNPARRSERAYRAILDATGELVADQGLAATSIDQIAARAGVGKQTIYRWWPNKAALVLTYAKERGRPVSTPDTGSLGGDLSALARELCATLSKSPAGRICAQLISSVEADADFAREFRETFVSARRATVLEVLGRWQERGQVRTEINLELAADLLYGPIWYRRLVQQAPLNIKFADQLAEAVLAAVKRRLSHPA
jgi:AcrR family transcriptional regulator